MTHLTRLSLVAVLVLLALPAAASAAVRHATPDAWKTTGGCPQETPCRVEWAIEGATEGDEIVIAPGTYNVEQPIFAPGELTIHGVEGQPRPRLVGADDIDNFTLTLSTGSTPTVVRHVAVESQRAGYIALLAYGRLELSDSVVVARGENSTALSTYNHSKALIRDSVVRVTKGGTAVMARGQVTLRNVTAIGQGTSGVALRAHGACDLQPYCDFAYPATVDVANTIARGSAYDVYVTSDGEDAPAQVDLRHSSWRPGKSHAPGDHSELNDLGNNQAETPAFRFAIWGDYHQVESSPTIDKGVATPENGPTDFDGQPRTAGAAVDIGADEFQPAASGGGGEMPSGDEPGPGDPPPGDPGTGGGGGAPSDDPAPAANPDVTAPALSGLSAKPRRFRAAKGGLSIAAKGGAKVAYTLDEPATLMVTVQRASAGRLAGGKCAKPKPSNAKAKRCTRWRSLRGGFAHAGSSGPNGFRFTGRIDGKGLAPGRYRLAAAPFDASGNVGSAALAGFEIVR